MKEKLDLCACGSELCDVGPYKGKKTLDKQGEEGAVASDSDATYAKMCPGGCGRTHKECIATYDAYVREALCRRVKH